MSGVTKQGWQMLRPVTGKLCVRVQPGGDGVQPGFEPLIIISLLREMIRTVVSTFQAVNRYDWW